MWKKRQLVGSDSKQFITKVIDSTHTTSVHLSHFIEIINKVGIIQFIHNFKTKRLLRDDDHLKALVQVSSKYTVVTKIT